MSFLKRLFGGGGSEAKSTSKTTASVEHKGFNIEAQPFVEGGQYQVAGLITKTVDGEVKSHRFVRADRCASADDATQIALAKGRQIVDQNGDRVFC
ncbi:MAG: hypothetical protein HOO99_02695 [Hyphomicrobiaceae bacterium]|nr:hypothetical protein [Hyphomicrobiaceae bacterium]